MKNIIKLISKHIIDILILVTIITAIVTTYISNNNLNKLLEEYDNLQYEYIQLKNNIEIENCNCKI